MFLQLFKGQQGVQAFAKKIHTQMCLASLFRQQQHRKVENEWNDDDDEQRQIFHEEEKNRGHAVPSDPLPAFEGRGHRGTCSGLVHCNHETKPDTYIIQYEGGIGLISR
uniref:Uncharacterized protein n=1 Tax=viral metagenome TaxID=1070528 RepID=A0A6C0EYQ7_9ZZZZ